MAAHTATLSSGSSDVDAAETFFVIIAAIFTTLLSEGIRVDFIYV